MNETTDYDTGIYLIEWFESSACDCAFKCC